MYTVDNYRICRLSAL